MAENGNGWAEHKRLVEYRLDRNEDEHKAIFVKLNEIHTDVKDMQSSKKVLIASISAGVSGVVAIILALIKHTWEASN